MSQQVAEHQMRQLDAEQLDADRDVADAPEPRFGWDIIAGVAGALLLVVLAWAALTMTGVLQAGAA